MGKRGDREWSRGRHSRVGASFPRLESEELEPEEWSKACRGAYRERRDWPRLGPVKRELERCEVHCMTYRGECPRCIAE